MNLFNIKQEYLTIAQELAEGELTPELEQQLAITETNLQEKAVNYGYVIKTFESEVDKLTTAFSPSNFTFTRNYGIAPSNTTLTV